MNIDGINTGYVLDHIKAGKGFELYHLLGLDKVDCTVAIIQRASSEKYGAKDIIKIDADIPIDYDLIGYISPDITVNIVKDRELVRKFKPCPPAELRNVIKCRNPHSAEIQACRQRFGRLPLCLLRHAVPRHQVRVWTPWPGHGVL